MRWRAAVNCVCCDEAVSASLHVMNIIYSPMMLVCRVLQAQMHPGRFARASADWEGCSSLGTQMDGHGSQMLPSFSRSGLRYTHHSLFDHTIIELSALEGTPGPTPCSEQGCSVLRVPTA